LNKYPKSWPKGMKLGKQGVEQVVLAYIAGIDESGRIFLDPHDPSLYALFIIIADPGPSRLAYITDGEYIWAYRYNAQLGRRLDATILAKEAELGKLPSKEAVQKAIKSEVWML
jgi:hypothetical protein